MVSKKTALSLNSPRPRLGHPWIRDTAFNPPSLNYCAILLSNALQFFWFYFINPHSHPLHIFGDCVTLYCKVVRNINEKTLATYCTPSRMFSLFMLMPLFVSEKSYFGKYFVLSILWVFVFNGLQIKLAEKHSWLGI